MLRTLTRNLLVLLSVAAVITTIACGTREGAADAAAAVRTRIAMAIPTPPSPPVQVAPGGMIQATTPEAGFQRTTGMKKYDAPPPMTIDPDKRYVATLVMEKGGEIVIELFAKEAPKTVNNFVFLAREGFYDGVTFHRVITDFMAQTGDPTGLGSGGPGYQFENELSPNLLHDGPGIVSMANKGRTATNGSRFFITYSAQPNLDGFNADGSPKDCAKPGVSCHSVFGKVIGGMDVLNGVTRRDPRHVPPPGDVITAITIEESE